MSFSLRAIEELEKRLRNGGRETGLTTQELQDTARLITGLIAASLKMRQRFSRVGRPIKPKPIATEEVSQGVLPGLEVDRRQRREIRRDR